METELPRVDVLVVNADINTPRFRLVEGYEQAVQVNVLNTSLLALLLLSKPQEIKALLPDSLPHLVVVGSEAYRSYQVSRTKRDVYLKLNEKESFSQQRR
jgi:NAD(P)-dependent dehydrogenase (short-subunit alcohol dehydrogenase family)